MSEKKQEIIDIAFETLEKELREEPLSPEKLNALINVIMALTEANPLL